MNASLNGLAFTVGTLSCVKSGAEEASAFRLAAARLPARHGHFGGDSTFKGFRKLTSGMTLDYVFVGPEARVAEHGTLADRWDGRSASDHLPVLAELEWPRPSPAK